MASVSQLLADLAALASECKRKHSAVRHAVDAAQATVKALASPDLHNAAPDAQIAMLSPFLVALESGNGKLIALVLPAVLRLAASGLFPAQFPAALISILHSFDIVNMPMDVQLKTLQVLPLLLLNYEATLLSFLQLLAVAARLANSSNMAVSGTAAATLQQIFAALFDKLRNGEGSNSEKAHQVSLDVDPASEKVQSYMLDDLELLCFNAFLDLSAIVANEPLAFLAKDGIRLRVEATLEIIENIITLNRAIFNNHPALSAVLRIKTTPGLIKVLNSSTQLYPMILRTLRVIFLLTSNQIHGLLVESELILSLTNHFVLDANNGLADDAAVTHPFWEKVLIIEMYKLMLGNFDTVAQLYKCFDHDPKKRNVLLEILSVLNTYVSREHSDMFSPGQSSKKMSKANCTLRVPIMDHLEKLEAPGSIPELYPLYLVFCLVVSFAEGVSEFVFGLSSTLDPASLEADVDFITSLNSSVFENIFLLFKKFIYCPMEPAYFHIIVRALQKYTHAVGLLGLSSVRDELLLLLCDCVLNSSSVKEKRASNGSNLLAIGESIVETLSTTIQNSSTTTSPSTNHSAQFGDRSRRVSSLEENFKSRSFDSRQVICLRALTNLAISLGSTLEGSWKMIWITLQWVDFILSGPEDPNDSYKKQENKGFADLKLSPQDLSVIRLSREKLLESLAEYQEEQVAEVFTVLFALYSQNPETEKELAPGKRVCPFNKSYFLKMMETLATIDYTHIYFMESEMWDACCQFFCVAATNRALNSTQRTALIDCFADIISHVTQKALETEKNTDELVNKALTAFMTFLNKLFDLGMPEERLILNCETEMHLTILLHLHLLIDAHDRLFQNSWDLVFKVLETAFYHTRGEAIKNNNSVERIQKIIFMSFSTLKLILDEFLTTLPFNQLKSLIDTLLNFCSQEFDLNISFSSVSYFWLISDCINSNINQSEQLKEKSIKNLSDLKQLEEFLASRTKGNHDLYEGLNIYLLAKLSFLSKDPRAQVREGAIQTLFQILDTRGEKYQSWVLIYDIVFPTLLELDDNSHHENGTGRKKDTIESLNLILSGLVSVYTKFLTQFENTDEETSRKFWAKLFSYMNSLLSYGWNDLNSKVFQSYQDVLIALSKVSPIPQYISRMLFEFWVNVSIDYDFVKPEYQDLLAIYNESFKSLFPFVSNTFSIADASKVLNNLSKCARYPVLKAGASDLAKPTLLQKSVIEILELIDQNDSTDGVRALVAQQLAQISAYPYEIRGRIEAKLKSKFEGRLQIPSFVAISEKALTLLGVKLRDLKSLTILFKEKALQKIIKNLLLLIRNRAEGILGDAKSSLWVQCNDLLKSVLFRLIDENLLQFELDSSVWRAIIECLTVNFEGSGGETVCVKQYGELSERVLPVFFSAGHNELVLEFVRRVYENSFIYKSNPAENAMMSEDATESYRRLAAYDFHIGFGSTLLVEPYENQKMRMKCLNELFRFTSLGGSCAECAREYLLARAAFAIRRFIADERFLRYKPLPQIQEREVQAILGGFDGLGAEILPQKMQGMMRLFSQSVVYASRIEGMALVMQRILAAGTSRG